MDDGDKVEGVERLLKVGKKVAIVKTAASEPYMVYFVAGTERFCPDT